MTDNNIFLNDVPVGALCIVEGNILYSCLCRISTGIVRQDCYFRTGERFDKDGYFAKLYNARVVHDLGIIPNDANLYAGLNVDSTLFKQYIAQQITPIYEWQTAFYKNTITFFDENVIPVTIAIGDMYRSPVDLVCPLEYNLKIQVIVQCCVADDGSKYVKPVRVDLDCLQYQKIWD